MSGLPLPDTFLLLKLQFRKHSVAELVSCNETQTLKANNLKVTIGVLKFVVELSDNQRLLETIPRSGGFNTPQLALGFIPVIYAHTGPDIPGIPIDVIMRSSSGLLIRHFAHLQPSQV